VRGETEVCHRWLGMIHRLGRLEIGETSVAIIVTAEHRRAAFEACQYALTASNDCSGLKKEFFADGAVCQKGKGRRAS